MPGFVLTNAAKTDLKSIGRYTQDTWGVEQRNQYLALLDASFHNLAANPLMGRDCGSSRHGYHKHPVGKHLVYYRQGETGQIEIVRILNQRMDVEPCLSPS